MSELRLTTDWSYRGLRAIILENRFLRLIVLPEVGAKIWQITYKPHDADLLWNNARIAPARLPMNSRYDDVWSGGWDELFPNDEIATIAGDLYPDHGELWTGVWQAEPFESATEVGVTLRFTTPISAIHIEKKILLRPAEARVFFSHVFRNGGNSNFPFLWKLHPAMAVTPQHRIDFPAMKVLLEPAFPGTLGGAPERNTWPSVRVERCEVDLRTIPPAEQRQLYFFYGTDMKAGWCALTNTETGLACGLKFDQSVFPCAWLFATYGGWRNYNVAVLEPCTGYPLNFEAMQKAGRHKELAPGGSFMTQVLFTIQDGVRSVGAIKDDGTVMEAAEEVLR
ncbi:MAG: DUF5107 domain-containing protein [Acidobacteria bacterium]|nr:MAG: DUF5107 domain-containing protein [Acidobacteriota bacterium]